LFNPKFVTCAATVLGAGLLAACGSADAPKNANSRPVKADAAPTTACLAGSEPSTAEELKIIALAGPEFDSMVKLGKDYTAATGVKITVEDVGRDGYETKLKTMMAGKSTDWDMALQRSESLHGYADAGWLAPLSKELEKSPCYKEDEFIPALKPTVEWKDETYGLPFMVPTPFFFYRTDLISNPPQTWDELAEVAKQFTKSHNPNSPTEYGLTYSGRAEKVFQYYPVWLHSFGGKIFDDNGDVVINSAEGQAALQYLVDLRNKWKVVPPDVTNALYPEVQAQAQSGAVAMAIQWNAAARDLSSAEKSPKIGGKMAVAPIPGVKQPDGSIKRTPYINALTLIANSSSKQTAEAAKFIAWFTSKDVGKRTAVEFGQSPAIASLYEDSELQKQLGDWWKISLDYFSSGVTFPPSAATAVYTQQLGTDLAEAIAGQTTSRAALDKAKQQITEAVER
jgi:multiple sugar transport system substrate-binding protein